ATLLHHRDAAGYPSRSELLFAFIGTCIRRKVSDETIIAACLDESYRGCAIREHVRENGDREYLLRQIRQAREDRDDETSQAQPTPTANHGNPPAEPSHKLIRNRLPEVGKGLLSGQWGTFKTFVFINMSCSIMVGGYWTGEPIYRQGGVLLFAPEGAR